MDIFVKGFPVSSTTKDINQLIKPHLNNCDIFNYYFQKIHGRGCAILTIANLSKANNFLSLHGFHLDPRPGQKPHHPILFRKNWLILTPSRNAPSDLNLRALHLDEKYRRKQLQPQQQQDHTTGSTSQHLQRTFETVDMYCGYWTYSSSQLVFSPQYRDTRSGSLLFGENAVALLLSSADDHGREHRIDIAYYTIQSVVVGHQSDPTVTFALTYPPRLYELPGVTDQFDSMVLSGRQQRQLQKTRLESLTAAHSRVVGSCFVYRMKFRFPPDVSAVMRVLRGNRKIHTHVSMTTPYETTTLPFGTQLDRLAAALQNSSIPFRVKFQVQRLAADGYLPPIVVAKLFPHIVSLVHDHGPAIVSESIRRFSSSIEFPGPGVEGHRFQVTQLLKTLKECVERFRMEYSVLDIQGKNQHLVLVHRVSVTPAGIYLDGPDLEVSNRVIRQYSAHSDHFIRVEFADEDGSPLAYDSRTSNERIYDKKYRETLRNSITIAGRIFKFLGFSHSSLRSQTCWFCAPFVHNGGMIHAPIIIINLGNFSDIRSPARCAARIGQAFSDTSGAIPIKPENLGMMPDIERHGRVFSDGCGTISSALLKKVWAGWSASKKSQPTVLQIRFQGVKGLVSLDTRLQGEMILIRPSMQKFEGSPSWDVELCGANFKKLPCCLNRPFIKILEDLGIPTGVFLKLQRKKVEELRMLTTSSVNASQLLEFNHVGTAAHLPTLISILGHIGVGIEEDEFLSGVVQVTTLSLLRQIKYRSRIPLDNGATLLGIMDETGKLSEREIYCVYDDKHGKRSLVKGTVAVTRSPALHPGDIQLVTAVDVPRSSPLRALNNCVVFSQHGPRDIPSMLSGGDLDGDLYNVIWDRDLLPIRTYPAADYPRVTPLDIGRPVKGEDMSDFLLTFMRTDRLGQISNMHLQFADRHVEGVHHLDCLKLAELASTAVDFSKTGVPINIQEIPKYDHTKPDFMAPGPRVWIENGKAIVAEREYPDDENDVVAALDEETRKPRYYESHKTLGVLFRDIDERRFLDEMEIFSRQHANDCGAENMMRRLLAYVKKEAMIVQWDHYRPLARELRETYETNMVTSMYNASPSLQQPVSEIEVFSGQIVGSTGFQGKKTRKYMISMREEFDRHVAHTVDSIRMDNEGNSHEALPRAIACLAVSVEEEGYRMRKIGFLKSWKYVAAAVCLEELEKFTPRGFLAKMG